MAEPERVQVLYRGSFREPVFGVLGNPAKLYANLLRHLAPFGADVRSLSINLSVLAEANVNCHLPSVKFGSVRVSLDHLEVLLPDAESQRQVGQVLDHAWSVMSETDESLRPVRHAVTLFVWARLKDEVFSSYIRKFVMTPPNDAGWKAAVEFRETADNGANVGVVHLEEAANIPEGLFLRSVVDLGAAIPETRELVPRFMQRFSAQLKGLDLELPLRVE